MIEWIIGLNLLFLISFEKQTQKAVIKDLQRF